MVFLLESLLTILLIKIVLLLIISGRPVRDISVKNCYNHLSQDQQCSEEIKQTNSGTAYKARGVGRLSLKYRNTFWAILLI